MNSIAILGFLGRWVTFSAIVLAVGAVVFRSAVVDRTTLPHVVRGALAVRAAAVAATACILVLPAAGIKLFVQTAGMRFPDDPWTSVATRLVRMTPWGHLWIAQVGLAAALAMAFGVARVRPRAWRIAAPLALGLALTPTLASHAMSEHSDRVVTVAADVLHLLGASAWLGSLAMVLLSIWRGDAEDDDANQDRSPVSARSLAASLLVPFSPIALMGSAVVLTSGVVSSMAHVNRTAALLGSPYGRVLVLKVATVAVVALLGWRNWNVLTPRLEVAGVDALRTSIVLELSAALLVLALTAALVITPPPMEGM